jgi:hypothetical protein
VPTIFQFREFAAAGGLMTYGGSLTDMYRQVGVYTGRNNLHWLVSETHDHSWIERSIAPRGGLQLLDLLPAHRSSNPTCLGEKIRTSM